MKLRTITILWVIAILLSLTVFFVKKSQSQSASSTTNRTAGQTLFEAFPATSVTSIHIAGSASSVTLVKQDDSWIVQERDNFPADIQNINQFLRTIAELKVTQGIKAGPSFASAFGMDEASSDPEKHGVTVSFKDSSGKEIATLSLGKPLQSSAQSSGFGPNQIGRYIRNHADSSGFYTTSETFTSISEDPKSWLKQDFIDIQRIKSTSVTEPGNEKIDWELIRENDSAEFQLTEAFSGVKTSDQETSGLKSLFANATFDDIIPAAKIETLSSPDKIQKAKIITFDNITYELTFQPTKNPESNLEEKNQQPTSQTYLLSINISGEPPTERPKIEGETPEAAEAAQKAFTEKREALLSQIEKVKQLSKYTYKVSNFTLGILLKNRVALMEKGAAPEQTPPITPNPQAE